MKNKSTSWLSYGILLLIVVAIVIAVSLSNKSTYALKVSDSPTLGPANAKVTVTEFFDFECPACQQLAVSTLPVLEQKYSKKVRFVYKQFPLPQHAAGKQAAVASVCAQDQNKFWDYRSLLVNNYGKWNDDTSLLDQYARDLSMDMTQFDACRHSSAAQGKVDRDVAEGNKRQIQYTPTVFINDEKVIGAEPPAVFEKKIDALLAK